MFYKNELDNLLWEEIVSKKPSEEKIRELVANGANLNAIEEGKSQETMFADILFADNLDYNLDLKIYKLLLELGADPNYDDGGYNCLFNALLKYNKKVVKLLLDYGANINALSFEDPVETILDAAYTDKAFCRFQGDRKEEKLMDGIIQLLEESNAKSYDDCFVKDLKMFLNIVPIYDTGLATYGGKIKITDIEIIPQDLATKFNDWLNRHDNTKVDNSQTEEGKNLAKEIKKHIPKNIRLKYYFNSEHASWIGLEKSITI